MVLRGSFLSQGFRHAMPLLTSQHLLWQVRHAPFLRWSEAGQRYEAPNALRSPWVKPDLPIPGTEDPSPCFYIRCWKLPAAPAIRRCSGREVSAALKPELWLSSFAVYRVMFGSRDTIPWCLPFRIIPLWKKSLFFFPFLCKGLLFHVCSSSTA